MCLETVTDRKDPQASGIGYKVLKKEEGRPAALFFPVPKRKDEYIPRKRWVTSEEIPIGYSTGQYYDSGFHILTKKEQAIELAERLAYRGTLVVYEVEWMNQLAMGRQVLGGLPIVLRVFPG